MIPLEEVIDELNLKIEMIEEDLQSEIYCDGEISDPTMIDELEFLMSVRYYLQGDHK